MEANKEVPPNVDEKQKERKKSVVAELDKKRKEIEEKNDQKTKNQELLEELHKK